MKTYLELSQDSGTAHKFYEVTVEGPAMTIRYGRIGVNGTTKTTTYASEEAALKEAQKKINAKKRKGYEEAVMGVRKKRAITRRSISSTRSSSKPSPVLWKFKSSSSAFGIYIDDNNCWMGNQNGDVYKLDHQGKLVNQFKLPDGVKCIIGDEDWIYVGCDDGNVYDLSGKTPRMAYTINENIDIYWLDISNGLLAVSDAKGELNIIDYEDEEQWGQKSEGSGGWMVRVDEEGRIYHGHSQGVTCYQYNGSEGIKQWNKRASGVLFGWRSNKSASAGTSGRDVIAYDKDGKIVAQMKADSAVYSNASSPEDEYFFAGDSSSSVYCFDSKGERLWKLGTTCGSAYSMQYHKEKVYIVTTQGTLACIDANTEAIEKAKAGEVPKYVDLKAPKAVAQVETSTLRTATASQTGVQLVCVKVGSKLRIRPLTEGYNADWNVQFPRNLRVEGCKYIVDGIREASQGGFYRYHGEIYKLT